MSALYRPLHADAYRVTATDLDPAFRSALESPRAEEAVTEVGPRVFAFRPFSADWCERLDLEIRHREAWADQQGEFVGPPNVMHDHGAVLEDLGFGELLTGLRQLVVAPLAARLYPDLGGEGLEDHHGYVVDYAADRDHDLGFHVDDSEVTLNLCLGERFSGSRLLFRGLRCAAHRQDHERDAERFAVFHEPGVAILHPGAQRHEVDPIESGRRRNLILWCRNDGWRRAEAERRHPCAPWCGAWDPDGPAR